MNIESALYGFKAVCPACKQGKIFQNIFKMRDNCPNCGYSFKDSDVGDGPAFFGICFASLVVTILAVIVELNYAWPLWLHAVVWSFIILLLSLLSLRILRVIFILVHYKRVKN